MESSGPDFVTHPVDSPLLSPKYLKNAKKMFCRKSTFVNCPFHEYVSASIFVSLYCITEKGSLKVHSSILEVDPFGNIYLFFAFKEQRESKENPDHQIYQIPSSEIGIPVNNSKSKYNLVQGLSNLKTWHVNIELVKKSKHLLYFWGLEGKLLKIDTIPGNEKHMIFWGSTSRIGGIPPSQVNFLCARVPLDA